MRSAKLAAILGAAALSLSACGSTAKPEAGTLKATTTSHKGVDDPRKTHIECLQQEHIPVRRETVNGLPAFQVGTVPSGPTVVFQATPGAAQAVQIDGQSQGAEVIGSALLYPNQAVDSLLGKVETCVAKGVSG
jgi:ABC-type glycerol-3-phosphate transport system substrate-binding protein